MARAIVVGAFTGLGACAFDVSGLLGATDVAQDGGGPDASWEDGTAPADGGAEDAGAVVTDPDGAEDAAGGPAYCEQDGGLLMLCFRFEGNVVDESTPPNDPSSVGTLSFVPGKVGQALRVSAESAITLADHPSFNVAAFTIEMWIRPRVIPATGRAGLFDSNARYGLFLFPNGTVQCNSGGLAETRAVPTGVWTHIACVHDGATLTVYQDGAAIASTASTMPAPGTEVAAIGRNAPSGDDFDGDLDNLRIWNVPRTAAQIREGAGLPVGAAE